MNRLRSYRSDLAAVTSLLLLALLWFAPVLAPGLTGKTLLPYDNLYSFEPWRNLQPQLIPHNLLLSDLVLENAVWKQHILRSFQEGAYAPLWNPQLFTGVPFLAAGQASTFYPLSALFYLLPLEAAYGWFTALQAVLAGINTYILARVLRLRPVTAFYAGLVFMFSGFLIVSVVFTMFMAAAVWLPLLLAVIERIIHKQEEKGWQGFNPAPYIALGVATIGLVTLAGHPELIYYTLLTAGLYALFRLLLATRRISKARLGQPSPWPALFRLSLWLLTMAVLGVAAGGVQLIPLLELLPLNFRSSSASLQQVLGWAWPARQVISFFLPNVFGNPSHHAWFDLASWRWRPVTQNALGQSIDTIFWGIKNYVEAGNYLGIAAWLLAAIAVFSALLEWRRRRQSGAASTPYLPTAFFFSGLALLSLLFAFGTPLYALLYYGLPGWNQLHSPFRWVFPFTLSIAILAGIGLEQVIALAVNIARSPGQTPLRSAFVDWAERRGVQSLVSLAAGGGGALLVLVFVSILLPAPFTQVGWRLLESSELISQSFADGAMFWNYQAMGLVQLGVFALLAALCLWQLLRSPQLSSRQRWPIIALSLLTFCDLYLAHGRFNPASDVALSPLNPKQIPPVVAFINQREAAAQGLSAPASPWRFTTLNAPGVKTFNANVGMYYGWHDLRGYDSIIPRQYAQLMERIAPQANELLYNRIAPLYSSPEQTNPLDNPLLDLLNVKYILTEQTIDNPSWQEIYRDPAIAVYENREVMARAFVASEARLAAAEQQPLAESDLRQTVFLETTPPEPNALVVASPQVKSARISHYESNQVFVDVNLSDRGWLVLSDAYFPGWKAYIRPFAGGENDEQETTIYRANGALRAVYLPQAGQWTVRFVYTPMSFKLGLYTSFLVVMTMIFLCGYWAWGRYYRPEAMHGEVRTVAKNTLVPTLLNLANKALDFAYAMLYIRLLGKEGTGSWYFVVAIYGVFEIISRYGLGTLLTRDVAEDKNRSSRYLSNVIALRTVLWLCSLPILAGLIAFYWAIGGSDLRLNLWGVQILNASQIQGIGRQEIQALALLAVSMLLSNWADALSSTFAAFEKMEYPAGLTSAANMIKVVLGPLALLLGYGFVGLAAISLLVNLITLLWLYLLLRSTLFKPEWIWDAALQRWMFGASGALMINHLLATIFWRIDIWILRPLAGAASVGVYSIGLKYLDGLNIIPSVFTMAVFPLMSRYARRQGDELLRVYILCLRLLVMIALPLAMTVTFLARPMASVVGGSEFLDIPETLTLLGRTWNYNGGADIALAVIIWSIPIGFVNSVTQFVLITVNQQRYLTLAFLLGVSFNIIGNLLLIPRGGYVAAALTTILSELSLLAPFYYSVRRNIGVVPWLAIFTAPTLSVVFMGASIGGLLRFGVNLWLSVLIGGGVYLAALILTGGLHREEIAWTGRKLPLGSIQRLVQRRYETSKDVPQPISPDEMR